MKKIFTVFALVFITFSCQKNTANQTQLSQPIITTISATAINSNSALSGGNVSNDGGDPVTQRGICWDTVSNPTMANNHTSNGTGMGAFVSSLTGLQPSKEYFIRAYATNSVGTVYGNEESFNTSSGIVSLPSITTLALSEIFSTAAKSGCTIAADGGATVTARGVCWSTTANPSVTLSTKTTDGTGVGTFISNITNLVGNTTYFIRAYATNSSGTAYSNELNFQTTAYTIYVAGTDENGPGSTRQAVLWRNGIPTVLNAGTSNAFAYSVFVSGNDIYVAGGEDDPNNSTSTDIKVWKNGVATILGSGISAKATSVFVSGNDVYVTGKQSIPPLVGAGVLWKNGVATVLNNGFLDADPQSVFIDGSDSYVAGYDRDIIINYDAKLWQNGGTGIILSGNNTKGSAFSVFVSGGDVYVAGYKSIGTKNVAMLWKNGVAVVLGNGTYDSYANSVYVLGSDVYVAGYESRTINNVAILWKNGVATDLSIGTNSAYANSVFVFGNDVFVAGEESSQATLWKNGTATILNNGPSGSAYSVFVK